MTLSCGDDLGGGRRGDLLFITSCGFRAQRSCPVASACFVSILVTGVRIHTASGRRRPLAPRPSQMKKSDVWMRRQRGALPGT